MNASNEEARPMGSPPDDDPRGAGHEPQQPEPPRALHSKGAPYPPIPLELNDPRRKNPALAGILSAMPGLGQIYVGYYPRGFVHVLVAASLITILNSDSVRSAEPLFGMFLAFFWLYNIIDAVRRASLYNQVLAGGAEPQLPDDFKMPTMGGSIFGGVMMLGVGIVLLLHTRFQMPLDFIHEWWPLLPMAFGVFLLARAIQDRAGRSGGRDDSRR
jgi:hypothetical protein